MADELTHIAMYFDVIDIINALTFVFLSYRLPFKMKTSNTTRNSSKRSIMHILLLGAGHIGSAIARRLVDSGDYQVSVVDRNEHALQTVAGLKLTSVVADTSDAAALAALLLPVDVV